MFFYPCKFTPVMSSKFKIYFVSLSQTFNFNKDEKNNSFPISYCLLDCV